MKLDIQKFASSNAIIINTEVNSDQVDAWLDALPQETKRAVQNAMGEMDKEMEAIEPRLEELSNKYGELMEQYNELTHPGKGVPIFESDIKQAEELRQQILGVIQELEEITGEKIIVPGINDMKMNVDDIGKKLKGVTKSVVKWGLALFGIQTAYSAIKGAISRIIANDPQMKADMDYIKSALTSVIEPVARGIVNLVKTLMTYLAYIIKMWTGKNIFANANKDLKSANKQAQEMQKTIAGFDEMNVLNEQSGGGESGATPSFDLSQIDGDVPGWVKWIGKNGSDIIAVLEGITAGLIAVKLFGLDPLMGLGIGLVVAGIVMLVQDLISFIQDPSWEGFINILGDIAIVIGGIMLLMGNWVGIIVAIVGVIFKLVADNWDAIKEILGAIGSWIYDTVIEPVANFFVWLFETVKTGLEIAWNFIVGVLSAVANWVKTHVIDPIANFFSGLWNGIKNGFSSIWNFILNAFSKGGQIFNGLKDGIVNVFKTIVNAIIDGINRVIAVPFNSINGLLNAIRNVNIPVINVKPFKGLWSQNPLPVPKIPKLAKGGIINMPGRGVAIGGEAGREGVIPLTDSQQMALLGEAIGKYINISATIPVYVGNRQIAREMRKIEAEDSFAFNR